MRIHTRIVSATFFFSSLVVVHPVQSAVFDIGNMTVTGGDFMVWDTGGNLFSNPDSTAPDNTVTPFTSVGANTDLVGGYIGNGGTNNDGTFADPASIANAIWFGGHVNIYTAATNLGDTNTPAGIIAGGPVPTGVLDDIAGTITMDLSSWINNWGLSDFNQGTGKADSLTSPQATGTWNPLTGIYSLTWDTSISDDFCVDCSHTRWTLEGVAMASPVPLPATIWLFGSGLLGMIAISRRKKAA